MKNAFILCAALAACLLPSAAHAQLLLSVDTAHTAAPGDVVTFDGTLTNSGTTALDLFPSFSLTNDPTGLDPGALLLDTSFLPATLGPGNSTAFGPLFSLDVDGAARRRPTPATSPYRTRRARCWRTSP